MSTFLFNETVFGPVLSRRMGISLGINLLPDNTKICSFNCVYCECGWTESNKVSKKFPTRSHVKESLENRLIELSINNNGIDAITFAGNGEPTLHPEFPGIIDDVLALRDKYFKKADVVVLSNATCLKKDSVINALLKLDKNIQKIDAGTEEMVKLINQPYSKFSIRHVIENLKKFNGNVIIQTLFLRGEINQKIIDNTTEKEINLLLEHLKEVKPKAVMIYSLARDTPVAGLQKVEDSEIEQIAEKFKKNGFEVIT